MSKRIKVGLALVSAVWLLASCGGNNANTKKQESTNGKIEQVARLAIPQEVASIDSGNATDLVSFGVINQINEGIYRLDETNKPTAAGAKELATVSEDGLEYTIKLREDAKWSNGDPVVADDYVYAWQRVVDPSTGAEYAYLFENVKNGSEIIEGKKQPTELGIEAVNDYELKITLANATPYFDYLLAFPTFYPLNKKAVEEYGKDYGNSSDKTIYNGPFVLTNFDGPGSDVEWSYEKNPNYWDKDNVKMEKIDAQVVKEASTALNLYEDNQLDDVIISGELAQQYREDTNFVGVPDGRTIYLEMNQERKDKHFENVNLRKALSYAVDGEAIVNNVLGDGSQSVTGIVPKGLASNPETGKDFVEESGKYKEFNEKKAKEYFEKAKKELNIDTLSFEILTDDNDSTKKIAEYIQGAYKDVLGIETEVAVVTKPIRLDRTTAGDFDMVVTGWGADYNDVSSFLDLFVTGNSYNKGKYSNSKYDKLIEEARTTNATNLEARWQNYLDAEKVLLGEDYAIIPLYQVVEGHLINPKIKGYVRHTAGAPYDYKYMSVE
ncbi:peptide ABC transporter substrate-binding protein [Vagococcus martis]|uniref:Peptide ABC transporter substrate-binding protein n=1 Tax=Vagococcus martis TaxID=1768210 RepID=A0A1V4DIY1_9ENTE|nr:peptide ABC transporter substrate-binding protein [Vagococcus martis]OPF88419.1 peptide ABC transporter substrate-binding protein [Vagococcus martis]